MWPAQTDRNKDGWDWQRVFRHVIPLEMVAVGAEAHLGLGVSQRTRTYILSYDAEADHVETSYR